MLETSAPSALADWLSGRRGSHSSSDHPLLVREKLEANYFNPCGAQSCQQKRHILQRWRHMHEHFYRHQGQNVDVGEYEYGYGRSNNGMGGAGGYGMGAAAGNYYFGGGGRYARENFKSDPEILVDFFFAKFADDGSDPDDPNQVRSWWTASVWCARDIYPTCFVCLFVWCFVLVPSRSEPLCG